MVDQFTFECGWQMPVLILFRQLFQHSFVATGLVELVVLHLGVAT